MSTGASAASLHTPLPPPEITRSGLLIWSRRASLTRRTCGGTTRIHAPADTAFPALAGCFTTGLQRRTLQDAPRHDVHPAPIASFDPARLVRFAAQDGVRMLHPGSPGHCGRPRGDAHARDAPGRCRLSARRRAAAVRSQARSAPLVLHHLGRSRAPPGTSAASRASGTRGGDSWRPDRGMAGECPVGPWRLPGYHTTVAVGDRHAGMCG